MVRDFFILTGRSFLYGFRLLFVIERIAHRAAEIAGTEQNPLRIRVEDRYIIYEIMAGKKF